MHRSIRLTAREREVLQARAQTGSISRIARRLGITEDTVHYHLKNIRRKFGIQDTGVLLVEALRRGLINGSRSQ